MKNLKKYFILFGAAMMLALNSSCEDDLYQVNPASTNTDNFFQTENDFTQAMRGTYREFYNYYVASERAWILVPDMLTDNVIINPNGRRSGESVYNWIIDPSNTPSGLYAAAYRINARANEVLANIDNLPDGDFKDMVRGECLAVRASVHLDLARAYSKIPTQSGDAGSSLGITYVDVYDPFAEPARNITVDATYERIIQDLTDAATLVPVSNDKGRFTKAAVYGIMSRAYLAMGDYPNTIAAADNAFAAGAIVEPMGTFADIWTDGNDDIYQVLLTVPVNDQAGNNVGVAYNQTTAGIFSEYVCSYDLKQLFGTNDIRTNAYIQTSPYEGILYNHVVKWYQSVNSSNLGQVNGKYLRSAEVLLNKAEAQYLNDVDDATTRATLNQLRSQRYTAAMPDGETGSSLLNAIMVERRKELAFESDRFFTLKRLGISMQRSTFGERADGSGTPPAVQNVPASDHRWQWPIPQGAIDENPNTVQNPGY